MGRSESGKTRRTTALLRAPIHNQYVPTLGCDVHTCVQREGSYTIWDLAGQPKFGGLRSGYLIGATVVIIFEGGTENPENNEMFAQDVADIERMCPNAVTIHHDWNWTDDELHARIVQALDG